MKKEMNTSDKLRDMPIPRLLAMMSAPAMLSMFVQALYNVVDSLFVARISEEALTALSLAFPMQMLFMAFSMGVGVGTNSLIARRLGEGRREDASQVAQLGLLMALVLCVIFGACGTFVSKAYISAFSAGETIDSMAISYLSICLAFAFGQVLEIYFNKCQQAMGNMIVPMISQLVGAITNIIFDPLFIFGMGPFPELGVRGAAIATVMGQVLAMLVVITATVVKRPEVKIFFQRNFRPTWQNAKNIARVGVPTMIMNAIGSVVTSLMNYILIAYSTTAVAVYGVYFKLNSLFIMPIFGLNQGSMPIMGYNYGAFRRKRFLKTYTLTTAVAFVFGLVATLVFVFAPRFLLTLFSATEAMYEVGVPALQILGLCLLVASFSVVMNAMFTAVGYGITAMWQSLLRQLVLLLPAAYFFGKWWGLNAVWAAFPICEFITLLIMIPVAVRLVKKLFHREPDLVDVPSASCETCELRGVCRPEKD